MRCLAAAALLLSGVVLRGAAVGQSAAATPPLAAAVPTLVAVAPCDALRDPAAFNGKMVQMQATVQAGLDDFLIRPGTCTVPAIGSPLAIWLDYPEGTHAKAGPAVRVTLAAAQAVGKPATATVHMDRSADFKRFDAALATPLKSAGMCLGCIRNTVTATLVGRIDAVPTAEFRKNASGTYTAVTGYGNLARYRARLVLQSVSDVKVNEVDYKAASPALGIASAEVAGRVDFLKFARGESDVFLNGTAPYGRMRRAALAYGAAGEQNGVTIHFVVGNEGVSAQENATTAATPDGLLFHVSFDPERLTGDALNRALILAGTHIADMRDHGPTPTSIELETSGWQTVLLTAFASRQHTLTLPGGAVVWNDAWPTDDRSHLAAAAVLQYMNTWKMERR